MNLTPEQQQIANEYLENNMYKLNRICSFLIAKKRAPNMYEDELYSIGRLTFVESLYTYNPSNDSNCKFKTYLIGNIWKAFYDWTRDHTRWKRCNLQTDKTGKIMLDENNCPIIISDISLDAPTEDGIDLAEKIASDFKIEEELSDEFGASPDDKWECYLEKLSKKQRKIAIYLSEGYKPSEIKNILHMTEQEYSDNMIALKSYENISILI